MKKPPDPIKDRIPYSVCTATICGKPTRPLLCLFDSGSTSSWISSGALPQGIQGRRVSSPITGATLAGSLTSYRDVDLNNLAFPEFYTSRRLDSLTAHVFHTPCRYDMILGRDLLFMLGLKIEFDSAEMTWDTT